MTVFRAFQNSDPPHIVRIWNSQPNSASLSRPMSLTRLEQLVLSRPFFRAEQVLVAEDAGTPIGFVHVGFGPNASGDALDQQTGVVCNLMISPEHALSEAASELLTRAESLLKTAGAQTIVVGGLFPVDPFYWGIIGGSLSAGIATSETVIGDRLRKLGYAPSAPFAVWERELRDFRPPVDRVQVQLKRKYAIDIQNDLPIESWWQAAVFSQVDRSQFVVRANDRSPVQASVTFWDMQHLTQSQGKRSLGLLTIDMTATQFQEGLATFLIADALRQTQASGSTHAEIIVPRDTPAWTQVLTTLGFKIVDERCPWNKTIS